MSSNTAAGRGIEQGAALALAVFRRFARAEPLDDALADTVPAAKATIKLDLAEEPPDGMVG